MRVIDDFIISHNYLLEYSSVCLVIFTVMTAASLIAAILLRNKRKKLRSFDGHSAFAREYRDIIASAALSSGGIDRTPKENISKAGEILEIYFEYEEKYKIK